MPEIELKPLIDLIRFHIKNHKYLSEQDVYKLLYQGTMGPRHLLGNPDVAKQYLMREWDSVKPDEEEPLTEPVSTNGVM